MSDLDRLIRFSVVAEELSFSQAARRLHVDQPWLSRQIQQLELQLGFALFVRSTRKVTLTPEGEELFAHTKELSRAADECRQSAREMTRSHNFELAIGVNPYTFWLPERQQLFEAFRARHQRVNLEVVSNYTPRLLSKLRKRLIDVALVGQPFDFPDLEALVIHTSPLRLLVPPEDALAKEERVPVSALAGRTIPVTNPRLNSTLHEIIYGPIFAAGAIPMIVPEGDTAIPYYAARERLPLLNVGGRYDRDGAVADFVEVALESPAPLIRYALLRRREPARGLLDHFWNTATRMVDEASGGDVTRLIPRSVPAPGVLPALQPAADAVPIRKRAVPHA